MQGTFFFCSLDPQLFSHFTAACFVLRCLPATDFAESQAPTLALGRTRRLRVKLLWAACAEASPEAMRRTLVSQAPPQLPTQRLSADSAAVGPPPLPPGKRGVRSRLQPQSGGANAAALLPDKRSDRPVFKSAFSAAAFPSNVDAGQRLAALASWPVAVVSPSLRPHASASKFKDRTRRARQALEKALRADVGEHPNFLTVTVLGAGQDVGRSAVYVRSGSRSVMFDCGSHLGMKQARKLPMLNLLLSLNCQLGQQQPPPQVRSLDVLLRQPSPLFAACVDGLFISHFHLDHCGALPSFTERLGWAVCTVGGRLDGPGLRSLGCLCRHPELRPTCLQLPRTCGNDFSDSSSKSRSSS